MKRLLAALLLAASPALADTGPPPPQYDVGWFPTEAETIAAFYEIKSDTGIVSFHATELGRAGETCDRLNRIILGLPYPALSYADQEAGNIYYGCYIASSDRRHRAIVYSGRSDEEQKEVLRHEIGHDLGWGADHDRSIPYVEYNMDPVEDEEGLGDDDY